MTDKKELNQEELEKVSGGTFDDDRFDELKRLYSNKIGMYDTEQHINETLFVYDRVIHEYYLGKLLRSYEKTTKCGTERTITLEVKESSEDDTIGKTIDICIDFYDCYISPLPEKQSSSLTPR